MAGINALIQKAEALRFEPAIADAVDETKEQFKDIQREQMLEGEGKSGKIGKYRSKSYAARKVLINPKPGFGNVDLKLTGAFQNEIFVDARDNSVVIDSADEKAGALIEKYGKNIFGLNQVNKASYSKNVMGQVVTRKIKKQLS